MPPSSEVKRFASDEIEVLRLLSCGSSIRVISQALHCSERTVRRRLRTACRTLCVETPIEAVVCAVRAGLI